MGEKDRIKVGCCGFSVSQVRYFKLFQVIEIQQTFYQLPQLMTAEKWRAAAPRGFEFTMKAWQLITHRPSSPTYRRLREKIEAGKRDRYGDFKETPEVTGAWERTAAFARALGARIIVFQCPASFRPTPENVERVSIFFRKIDRADFRFAWEPRGAWAEKVVLRLCRDLDLIHCVDPFKDKPLHGDFLYFRLHGIGGYDYRYTEDELTRLGEWVGRKPAYFMFNNTAMKEDALRFLRRMES